MDLYFSEIQQGFFSNIEIALLPKDVRSITSEEYQMIYAERSKGKQVSFDNVNEKWVTRPQLPKKEEVLNQELQWQELQISKVEKAISDYQLDASISEAYSELRKTNFTEGNYYSLLGDRKLLVEYIEQSEFPDCGRPNLSGLAN